jgi:multidrug efflux pump subunit AcrA (membrane-fusion protein)
MKPVKVLSLIISIVIVAVAAFGAQIMLSRADKAPDARQRKPTEIQLAPAVSSTVSRVLSLTGEIVAADRVTISSAVEGTVRNCPWREGDTVEKGAKLAEIGRENLISEVKVAEAAVSLAKARLDDLLAGSRPEEIARASESIRQIEAALEYARSHHERMKTLMQTGSASADDLDKAKRDQDALEAQLASARKQLELLKAGPSATEIAVQEALLQEANAKLDLAKTKLAESVVFAPFDATVLRALVRDGDYVGARTSQLEIDDLSTLLVRFSVPEASASVVKKGMKLTVALDPLPGRKFSATVARAFPEVDTRLRTREVEAVVDDPSGLLPGMFARVALVVETIPDAVLIQSRAVLKGSGGRYMVFTGPC